MDILTREDLSRHAPCLDPYICILSIYDPRFFQSMKQLQLSNLLFHLQDGRVTCYAVWPDGETNFSMTEFM